MSACLTAINKSTTSWICYFIRGKKMLIFSSNNPSSFFFKLEEIAVSQEIVVPGLDEVIEEEDIERALWNKNISGEMRKRAPEKGT